MDTVSVRAPIEPKVAAYAMLVDAKDEGAVAFSEHHGFQKLTSQPRSLFLALATAAKVLGGRGPRPKT